jgi:hypothetical protein
MRDTEKTLSVVAIVSLIVLPIVLTLISFLHEFVDYIGYMYILYGIIGLISLITARVLVHDKKKVMTLWVIFILAPLSMIIPIILSNSNLYWLGFVLGIIIYIAIIVCMVLFRKKKIQKEQDEKQKIENDFAKRDEIRTLLQVKVKMFLLPIYNQLEAHLKQNRMDLAEQLLISKRAEIIHMQHLIEASDSPAKQQLEKWIEFVEGLKKINNLFTITNRVHLDEVANILKVSRVELMDILSGLLQSLSASIRIEGDYILINPAQTQQGSTGTQFFGDQIPKFTVD